MAAGTEATAPSPATRERPRARAGLALSFAIAALAAAWNPLAAPIVLALRARRRSPRRGVAAAALVIALLASVTSVAVLMVTAGAVGVELEGEPVVKGRTPEELDKALSEAGERTSGERQRAARELDRLLGPRPADVGAP